MTPLENGVFCNQGDGWVSTTGSSTTSAVADAIEILEGDWHRKGRLEASDISRIAAKRNLDLEELHAVLEGLKAKGISAVDPDSVETTDAGTRSKYLTREQEKSLTNEMRVRICDSRIRDGPSLAYGSMKALTLWLVDFRIC